MYTYFLFIFFLIIHLGRAIKMLDFKTHCNFKSLDPQIQCANDIYSKFSCFLHYQYLFDKRSVELKDYSMFEIDLESIDRLYYISLKRKWIRNKYRMDGRLIVRVTNELENEKIYLELVAGFESQRNKERFGGTIFLTTNKNHFLNLISMKYRSLIPLQIQIFHDQFSVPELQTLCFKNLIRMKKGDVSPAKEIFKKHISLLPIPLKEQLEDFMKFEETKKVYFLSHFWKWQN